MLDSRAEREAPWRNAATPSLPGDTDKQDQGDEPTSHKKTILEHAREAMEEHAKLGMLLAGSERQCRESRTRDLPDRLDKGDQPGRRSCPDP